MNSRTSYPSSCCSYTRDMSLDLSISDPNRDDLPIPGVGTDYPNPKLPSLTSSWPKEDSQNPLVICEREFKSELDEDDHSNPDKSSNPIQKCTKWEKPNVSYVYMIQEAILQSTTRKLQLSDIYRFIEDKYPHFKQLSGKNRQSWQNSIRHNLSLNECFVKLSREMEGSKNDRKGNFWTIRQDCEDQFEPGNCKRRGRMKRKPSKPYPTDNPNWILAGWQTLMAVNNSGHPAVEFYNQSQSASTYPSIALPPVPRQLPNYPTNFDIPMANLMANSTVLTNPIGVASTAAWIPDTSNDTPINFCVNNYYHQHHDMYNGQF